MPLVAPASAIDGPGRMASESPIAGRSTRAVVARPPPVRRRDLSRASLRFGMILVQIHLTHRPDAQALLTPSCGNLTPQRRLHRLAPSAFGGPADEAIIESFTRAVDARASPQRAPDFSTGMIALMTRRAPACLIDCLRISAEREWGTWTTNPEAAVATAARWSHYA